MNDRRLLRLYWLGPATEFGRWALDTGPGTPVLRLDDWEIEGTVTSHHDDHAKTRPRGWLDLTYAVSISFLGSVSKNREKFFLSTDRDLLFRFLGQHGKVLEQAQVL